MFDFPASPSVGTIYAPAGGPAWQWTGSAWAAVSPTGLVVGSIVVTVLSTPGAGNYVKPAGLKFLEVTAVGGGGGGALAVSTAAAQASCGGGGGGGGTAIKLYKESDLSATTSYTVGAAGAQGNPSTNGGNTTFAGLTANGGGNSGASLAASGAAGQGSIRGSGGVATGGDLNVPGGDAWQGIANPHNRIGVGLAGIGGGSVFASAQPTTMSIAAATGTAGNFPGGGGNGASNGASQATPTAGGAGGGGMIMLKEYY